MALLAAGASESLATQGFQPIDPSFDTAKLVSEVSEHFQDSYNFLKPYFSRFLRYYKLYRGFVPPKTRPWRANVVVPIAFANVEHGLATMMEAFFGSAPLSKVFPREGNDYRSAQLMESYMAWEDDDMNIFVPFHEHTKEALLYGTGWSKTYWDWVENRNTKESVSVFNLFPDPNSETVDDAEFIQHRALRSAGYLKRMLDLGVYQMEDPAQLTSLAAEGLAFTVEGEQLLASVGLDARMNRKRIEVLEEWRQDGSLVTVLNRRVVVRAQRKRAFPHPWYPFTRWVDHTVPHELMGLGDLEVIEKLIDMILDMRNQRLDIVSQAINNIWVAGRGQGIDPGDLVSRPGQVVWANDVNAVKTLVQNAQMGPSVQEEQIARYDVQEATGNWGYNQGQTPNRRETATTVLALQRAAGLRFTAKVRLNEEAALKREAKIRMANAQEFLTDERWIRITGQPIPQRIFRDQIQGKFDFIPAASTAEPKEAKRQQLAVILPHMLNSPRFDDYELWDWVLDLYNVKEKEKFLLNDQELFQKLAQFSALGMGHDGKPAPGGTGTTPGNPNNGQTPESLEQISPEDMQMIQELASRAGGR